MNRGSPQRGFNDNMLRLQVPLPDAYTATSLDDLYSLELIVIPFILELIVAGNGSAEQSAHVQSPDTVVPKGSAQ